MTRAALILLLLAGCATAPTEPPAPHPERVGWSLMPGGYSCPIYDQGVGVLCGVHRFGDEDDVFNSIGVTVDALGRP